MAASETREGPGWWMATDGGWNPPEMWPEATPPLPGWIRQPDGSWKAPVERAPVAEPGEVNLTSAEDGSAVIDLTKSGRTLQENGSQRTIPTMPTISRTAPTFEYRGAKASLPARTTEAATPVEAEEPDRPAALSFSVQQPPAVQPQATSRTGKDRDPRVFAIWVTVGILSCIAGLLAVLVLL